jgi:hypothetical protein
MVLVTSAAFLMCLIQLQPLRAVAGGRSQGSTHVRRHLRKSGLLTGIATKVADARDWLRTRYYEMNGVINEDGRTYSWLDDHRLLFMRAAGKDSIDLYLFDIRTKTRQMLPTFQPASVWPPTWFKPSPDGKWLAWPSWTNTNVASLDGKIVYPITDNGYDNCDSLQWLSDGHRLVFLTFYDGDRLVRADLHSGPRYQAEKQMICTNFEYLHLTSATLVHDTALLCISGTGEDHGRLSVSLVSTALDGNGPREKDWIDVRLPPAKELEDARPNRHGDRIAWLLWRRFVSPQSKRMRSVMAIWISDARGKHMREIGWLPVSPTENGPLEFSRLRWLPDDRHLSFVYHGALYVVPAR